jgi:hypothetical protein
VVAKILGIGNNVAMQAAVLHAVVDHPELVSARKLAGIASSREQAANNFMCQQSARMMERNWTTSGTRTAEKHDAVDVMLTFRVPLPDKTSDIPSMHQCAWVLGVPSSTLACVDQLLIKKRQQLSSGERGIYWALANCKKGYSKIGDELCQLLIDAFNNHPHVIMSPNAKDTLLIKNDEGEKVPVWKILTQVVLGTIFLDIVRENPTIKHKVGKRTFQYFINQLGCVRHFTDSYKTMCGCTQCGLHTLHWSLQAKWGGVRCQIVVDLGQGRTKVPAQAMARGWGDVTLHPTPRDAIIDGSCERWSSHAVPHWECQTLQCSACKAPPVPEEEAREGAGAEEISFHVYEYKSLNGWTEKRGGSLSWFKSAHQLESFIVSFMGQNFLVQDIITRATC